MKTLTPDQRMEGFIELETEIGEGGVGGAHLMSFLAGVAHAEKVLASQEQDAAPVGYVYSEYGNPRKNVALSNDSIPNGTPVYLHPAPREFVGNKNEK